MEFTKQMSKKMDDNPIATLSGMVLGFIIIWRMVPKDTEPIHRIGLSVFAGVGFGMTAAIISSGIKGTPSKDVVKK